MRGIGPTLAENRTTTLLLLDMVHSQLSVRITQGEVIQP